MALSFDTGGQIGSDGTGNISGTLAADASADAIVAFVVQNAAITDQITSVTADGVSMTRIPDFGSDSIGELGRVDAFFLGNGSQHGGSQTIALTVSGSAQKRLYAGSFLAASGSQIGLFKKAILPGDTYDFQTAPDPASTSAGKATPSIYNNLNGYAYMSGSFANPTADFVAPNNRTILGVGAMFSGAATGSITAATNNTAIAAANFSGTSSQSASFVRRNSAVNNATMTVGWSGISDDVAGVILALEELVTISGNVTHSGSGVSGAKVSILIMDGVGTDVRHYATVTTDGSGNWSSAVPAGCKWIAVPYYTSGGNMYNAVPHMSIL